MDEVEAEMTRAFDVLVNAGMGLGIVAEVVVIAAMVPFTEALVRGVTGSRVETSGIVVDTFAGVFVSALGRFAKPTAGGLYRYTE